MPRFVRGGVNWEGRAWALNGAVNDLCGQVEEAWPERHPADGTVASSAHDEQNPRSDHRPTPWDATTGTTVHAVDVGEVTEDDGAILAEQLRLSRDPRIKYVIHERRLFSSYSTANRPAWEWGPYSGYNAHLSHVHVSVLTGAPAGRFDINLQGDNNMADHVHEPMPDELPRAWADEAWAKWVERSGTVDESRGWTFYREDLSWVYGRIVQPLEHQVATLSAAVATLSAELEELRRQVTSGGISRDEADDRYLIRGEPYRIG